MLGATLAPAARSVLPPRVLLAACAAAVALNGLVLALSHTATLDGVALALGGTGWIMALGRSRPGPCTGPVVVAPAAGFD